MTFWIPWAIDLGVAIVFVYFFFIGLDDGSVSSFNMGLWLVILCALGGVIGGGLALRRAAHIRLAKTLVLILALPSAFIGLVYVALLATPARWW